MSFTVWVYAADNVAYHDNDLHLDTLDDRVTAEQRARERVAATPHNTGWARLIDNQRVGRLGDCSEVAVFKKNKNGRVYRAGVRL